MPSNQKRTKTYSHESAQRKIEELSGKGYTLIGDLPQDIVPWASLRLGLFLFIKEGRYYQYKAKSLFLDSKALIPFDENDEPLAESDFKKITDNNYIYVIHAQKKSEGDETDKLLVLLREDALRSGHSFLIGPYLKKEGMVIGGEVYYFQGRLLLINHKSGSFPKESSVVIPYIKRLWDAEGEEAFYSAIEAVEVALEVTRRQSIARTPVDSESPAPALDPLTKHRFFKVINSDPAPGSDKKCSCRII